MIEQEAETDPFAALFSDWPSDGSVYCELSRLTPEIHQGVTIKGYLEKLYPGHDLDYIRNRYGGGRFKLNKKDDATKQIMRTWTIDISGPPKIPTDEKEPPVTTPTAELDNQADLFPKVKVAGVQIPITRDMERLKEILLFIKTVEAVFPTPRDYNAELIELLKDRYAQPPQDNTLEKIIQLREAFPEMFNNDGKGDISWPGVVLEGLKTTQEILTTPGVRRRGPIGKIVGARPGISPGKTAPESVQNPNLNPQTGVESMSMRDLALAAVAQVVASFRLRPTKAPERVVKALDMTLQLVKPDERQQIESYRETLFDMAENELVNDFEENEILRAEFETYYNQVFDLYVKPDRAVTVL